MTSMPQEFPNRPGVSVATMLQAVASQADLIPGVIKHVAPQARAAVSTLAPGRITNIFITGCGDSLYAALATRLAFEKYSGYRTEPIEALEFSRYTVDYLPKGALVIGVSAGGGTSRPVEALRAAREAGATTFAVTGRPGSPLSEAAHAVVIQNESAFRVPAPTGEGTFALGNYLGSMLGLYLLAFELGLANGTLTPARYDSLIAELLRAPEIIQATIKANEPAIQEYASSVASAGAYYLLGGGPSYATVLFMAAKLFEMPQAHGVPVELEEWAHEQYFLTRPDSVVMVVSPPGSSTDRAREQITGARDVGGRVVAICDQHDDETRKLADVTFVIMGELPEEFSPLVYAIPGELFAAYVCRAQGKQAFAFINERQYEVNMRQISQSRQR